MPVPRRPGPALRPYLHQYREATPADRTTVVRLCAAISTRAVATSAAAGMVRGARRCLARRPRAGQKRVHPRTQTATSHRGIAQLYGRGEGCVALSISWSATMPFFQRVSIPREPHQVRHPAGHRLTRVIKAPTAYQENPDTSCWPYPTAVHSLSAVLFYRAS
jgi:hypothetical protein